MPIPSSQPSRAASLQSTGVRQDINQAAPILDGIKRGISNAEDQFRSGFAQGQRNAESLNKATAALRDSNFKKGKSQLAIDQVRYNNELNQRLTQPDVSTDNALEVIGKFDEKFKWNEMPSNITEDQQIELEQTRELARQQIFGKAETTVFEKVEADRIDKAKEAAGSILEEHGVDGFDAADRLLEENGLSEAERDSFTSLTLEVQREERSLEFRKEIDAAADKFQEDLDLEAFGQLYESIDGNPDLTESQRKVAKLEIKEQENRALREYTSLVSNFQVRVSKGIATDADLMKISTFEDTLPPEQYASLVNSYENMPKNLEPEDTSYRQDNVYRDLNTDIFAILKSGEVLPIDQEKAYIDDITNSTLPPVAKGELLKKIQQIKHSNLVKLARNDELDELPRRFADFNKEEYELVSDTFTSISTSFQNLPNPSEEDYVRLGLDQDHLLSVAKRLNQLEVGSPQWKQLKTQYDEFAQATRKTWAVQTYRSKLNGR